MAITKIDYSTKDYEGFREDLIKQLKIKIQEYSDFSESDAGIVLIELLSYGLDILSYYTDKVANELYIDSAQERESLLKLCKFLNYTPKGATSSELYQVAQIAPRTTDYVLNKGFQFTTDAQSASDRIIFEVKDDFTIPANCTGLETDSTGAYKYKFPIIQGFTMSNDILGSSNGTAYQKFTLNYKPVVSDSLQVFVNEGTAFRLWDKVDNFIDSDDSDLVYRTFENSEGATVIEFGSGASGKIPDIFQNGIMATYRVGGGTQGNVAANTITKVVSNISDILKTFNPDVPYKIGTDTESKDEIRVNAPASLRTIGERAVSLTDYKDIMLLRGDVLLCLPKGHDDRTTVELVTLLKSEVNLSDDYKAEIIDYFDDKKDIGYTVMVTQAVKKPLNITVNIESYPKYVMSTIQTNTTTVVKNFLADGNMDIEEEFIPDALSAEIRYASIGIKRISILCTDTVGTNEYATLGSVTVNVTGGV
jgi:uncharacterized phage protein gp47/JayE